MKRGKQQNNQGSGHSKPPTNEQDHQEEDMESYDYEEDKDSATLVDTRA